MVLWATEYHCRNHRRNTVLIASPRFGARQNIAVQIRRLTAGLDRDTPTKPSMFSCRFFRDGAAYVVGRLIWEDDFVIPLVLVFRHESRGVVVDAVILDEDATSILFSLRIPTSSLRFLTTVAWSIS